MVKASPISVRLEQETRAGIERAARADKRTLNSMIEKALSDWLTDNGFAENPEPPKSPTVTRRRRKAEMLGAAA
jgi:hypothetical protein